MKLLMKAVLSAVAVVVVGGMLVALVLYLKPDVTSVPVEKKALTRAEIGALEFADRDVFVDRVLSEGEAEPYFPLAVYDHSAGSQIFFGDKWYITGNNNVLRLTASGTLDGVTHPKFNWNWPSYSLANVGHYLFMAFYNDGVYQVDLEKNRIVAVYNQYSGLENVDNLYLGVGTSVWVGTFHGQGWIDPDKRTIDFRLSEKPSSSAFAAIPDGFIPQGYHVNRRDSLVSDREQPEFQVREWYYPIFHVGERYYLVHTNGVDLFEPGDRFPKSIYEGTVTSPWIDWDQEKEERFVTSDGRYLIWITNDISEYDGRVWRSSIDVFDTEARRHVVMSHEFGLGDNDYDELLRIEEAFRQDGNIVYVGSTTTKLGIYKVNLDKMTISK